MALDITDTTITSTVVNATAKYERAAAGDGGGDGWIVSWLPTRVFDRDAATTAMSLAELHAEGITTDKHRALDQAWREEIGLPAYHSYIPTELEAKRGRQERAMRKPAETGKKSVRLSDGEAGHQ